jgi:beta-galactosidase
MLGHRLAPALALLSAFTAATSAFAQAAALVDPRLREPLNTGWSFHKGSLDPAQATASTPPDTIQWQQISLPHTWNAQDGQDGGGNYFRGDGWYRRTVSIKPEMLAPPAPNVPGGRIQTRPRKVFLKFEGANRRADVYLNGQLVGSHAGGTQAFIVDITPAAKIGDNLLAVRVDNKADPDSPPLQADFTFFGGIYRGVELISTNTLHIAMNDYGSPGVYLTTPEINEANAHVVARTLVQNDTDRPRSANVFFRIFDHTNTVVATGNQRVTIPANRTEPVSLEATVHTPHLWNGRQDPYLYTARISVVDNEDPLQAGIVDAVAQPLGLRTYSVDPERGFILNGRPYPLYGVNRHQDRKDKGWAISKEDHDQDMALIKEMGCTSIRLAHYQHAEYFYQLCDKEGMVVWAEIPVVDRLGSSQAFTDNAKQQYIELIRQNYNHPSIAFWSAGNEVDESGGNFNRQGPANVYNWFREMHKLGKQEDPTRLTAAAYRERFFPPADVTDVFGLNIYLGWYNNTFQEVEDYLQKHSANGARGKFAITEYGAGASIFFHSETPQRMDHTEEYQNLYHEENWRVLKKHPEVWGKYIWNMFDFAVDGRFEGDRAGINDKGLVTQDRKVKKDAFYFYKASWSQEPVIYLTSKRFSTRGKEQIPVKVYSNAPRVLLTVNGKPLSEKTGDNATFVWENVALNEGPNVVVASATTPDGRRIEDTATWTYMPGAPAEVYIGQDEIMTEALKTSPPRVGLPRRPGGRPAATRPTTAPTAQ